MRYFNCDMINHPPFISFLFVVSFFVYFFSGFFFPLSVCVHLWVTIFVSPFRELIYRLSPSVWSPRFFPLYALGLRCWRLPLLLIFVFLSDGVTFPVAPLSRMLLSVYSILVVLSFPIFDFLRFVKLSLTFAFISIQLFLSCNSSLYQCLLSRSCYSLTVLFLLFFH